MEGSISGGDRVELGLGRAVSCTPRDMLLLVGGVGERALEGISPLCVPILPKVCSELQCFTSPRPFPPMLSHIPSLGKSSQN